MIGHLLTFKLGALLAAGFALGGVTRPETIVGFLDFTGDWNPAVLFVIGAAVAVTFVVYRLSFRRSRPLLSARFMVPTRRDIDARLVIGAAVFGVGWGLVGLCPGPVLASLATGAARIYVFAAAMVGGMVLYSAYERARAARAARRSEEGRARVTPVAARQS